MSPGDPKMLNLPGLIDSSCSGSCVFQRVVTDLVGGASWVAAAKDLMEGVNVIISPSSFALANGASQALTITVDLSQAELVGQWVYGNVRLASNGLPDAIFPLAVYASDGEISSIVRPAMISPRMNWMMPTRVLVTRTVRMVCTTRSRRPAMNPHLPATTCV